MTNSPAQCGRAGRIPGKHTDPFRALQAVILAALINTVAASVTRASEPLPYFVDPGGTPTWTDKPTSLSRQVREFSLALQSWCSSCDASDPQPVILAALDSARCGQQCQLALRHLPGLSQLDRQSVKWLVLNLGTVAGSEAAALIESAGWEWIEPVSMNRSQLDGQQQLAALACRYWSPMEGRLHSVAGGDHLARQSLPIVLLDSNGWIRGVYDAAQPGEAGRLGRDLARVE